MKKIAIFAISIFAAVLLALHFTSCITCDCYASGQICYSGGFRGSGKVYMSNGDIDTSGPVLTETMLEVGNMSEGILELTPPESVDSLFLTKLDSGTSPGMHAEPLGVEVWFYEKPLVLINGNGMYIGDIEYLEVIGKESHRIFYWYFSEAAKINHSYYNEETKAFECRYNINARKGWNTIYFNENIAEGRYCYTTDYTVDFGRLSNSCCSSDILGEVCVVTEKKTQYPLGRLYENKLSIFSRFAAFEVNAPHGSFRLMRKTPKLHKLEKF
ncbi:MAG: hypothetical protein LBH25_10670 [Fibromonadaceae bacterium]|jgi:hypothetical protein|nr:hypothetical protein [Fibromonadaceae bacterium]